MQSLYIRYANRVFPLLAVLTLHCGSTFGTNQSEQSEVKPQDRTFTGRLDQVQNPDRSQTVKCTDLPTESFGPEVKIESANVTPATPTIPEHCDVRGTIWPEKKFALKLRPLLWSPRLGD